MDPINDIIWNEEDDNDIMPTGLGDGVGMIQTCQISMSSCHDEGGGSSDGLYVAGRFSDTICGC